MPAAHTDPLQILLSHDHWATTQLLQACAKLSPDPFHRRFDIGPGSLHLTLTHILAAMRAWSESLAGHEPTPRIDSDGQTRTPHQLLSILDQTAPILSAESTRRPMEEMVTRRTRTGQTIHLSRAAVLAQVATHGMHHRAQCLNMLRQLGVHPLPLSSIIDWTLDSLPQP